MNNLNDNFLNQNIEELYEEEIESVNEDEQTQFVLSEAIKRIEQAKLYEMLLKHQLFGSGSARPEIIAAVEKEMKQFILSRLEILLGMKSEGAIASPPPMQPLPFSKDQTDALLALADKLLSKQSTGQMSLSSSSANPTLNPINGVQMSPAGTLNAVVKTGSPTTSKNSTVKRKRSNNVSQVTVQKADGSTETLNTDYSQAVNPANPPKKLPTQAEMDQMNAMAVARSQSSMSNNDLGRLLGSAITLSQQKNAHIKEE